MRALLLWLLWVCVQGRPQQAGVHQHSEDALVRVQPRDISIINEPSCDELKAMWRFSKRQARAPEIMNEISTMKQSPLNVNEWLPYYSVSPTDMISTARSVGGPSYKIRARPRPQIYYGRVINKAPLSSAYNYAGRGYKGYDSVIRALQGENNARRHNSVLRYPGGGIPPQAGRFNHLKELVRNERARELQEQRAAEELAARAAALKDMAAGQIPKDDQHGYKPWSETEQWPKTGYKVYDDHYYNQDNDRYYQGDEPKNDRNEGVITYPNLLAPPTRRNGGGIHYLDSYYYGPHPREMLYYDPSVNGGFLDDHSLMRHDSEHNASPFN